MDRLIHARRIITGTGDPPIMEGALLVRNGRIAQVASRADVSIPSGTEQLDLGDTTVLPGLIDMHGHLGMDAMGLEEEQLRQPDAFIAVQATKNARTCLASGVTTMRIVGEKNFVDVSYKRALEEGTMVGPRVLISTRPIVATGGYGVFSGFVAADGPHEVRKVARENLKAGADLIKLFVTGGGTYKTKALPLQAYYTLDEIQAAVDITHSFGKKVAVHAHGGLGAQSAIRAGVDTIDHGHFLSEEEVALMAEHGTALVSTMGIHLYPGVEWTGFPHVLEYRAAVEQTAGLSIKRAKKYGATYTLGTDAMHGLMWYELYCAVRYADLTPMEAIISATKTAAEVCGIASDIGSLEAGKWADLFAVEGNPLEEIERLANVKFVMKEGQSYEPGTLTAGLARNEAEPARTARG